MAKRKPEKTERIDAKGDKHIAYADGRCEIYHKWVGNEESNFMEITDDTDKSINRRRYIPWTKNKPIEETLETREDATPGRDFDDPEIEGA